VAEPDHARPAATSAPKDILCFKGGSFRCQRSKLFIALHRSDVLPVGEPRGEQLGAARPCPSRLQTIPPTNTPTKQGPKKPPQAIAIDEDSATQHTSIIDTRLPLALGKERRQPLDLRGQSAV